MPDQSTPLTSNREAGDAEAGEQPSPEPSEPSESSDDSLIALCSSSLSPRSSWQWQRRSRQESQWSTYLVAENEQLDNAAWCVSNGIPPSGLLDDIDYDTDGKCLVCYSRPLFVTDVVGSRHRIISCCMIGFLSKPFSTIPDFIQYMIPVVFR